MIKDYSLILEKKSRTEGKRKAVLTALFLLALIILTGFGNR